MPWGSCRDIIRRYKRPQSRNVYLAFSDLKFFHVLWKLSTTVHNVAKTGFLKNHCTVLFVLNSFCVKPYTQYASMVIEYVCAASKLVFGTSKHVKNVKEVDLYSAFIEVPHTQGAQVRITQCYLQTTPYLPLPRKHSPDGASTD